MTDRERTPLPPGAQPYDRLNGIRVGALLGGAIAIIPAALVGGAAFWLLGGGIAGGISGYLWEKRTQNEKQPEG